MSPEPRRLAQNRLWSPAVEDLPSQTIADDEDDHADQDAATEREQGRCAGRVRDPGAAARGEYLPLPMCAAAPRLGVAPPGAALRRISLPPSAPGSGSGPPASSPLSCAVVPGFMPRSIRSRCRQWCRHHSAIPSGAARSRTVRPDSTRSRARQAPADTVSAQLIRSDCRARGASRNPSPKNQGMIRMSV
jgi:hypothetical protein